MALQMRQPVQMSRNSRCARVSSRSRTVTVRANAVPKMPFWPAMFQYLRSNNLRTVAPEDAIKMVKAGKAVVVDVRPRDAYDKSHIEGSVSVPIYRALDMSSGQFLQKALKWVAYAANGVNPIEPNPDFAEDVKQATKGGKAAIMVCEAGGTMKPSVNFPEGKASRSLQSCYRAISESLAKETMHLERGIYGWYQAELPFTGQYKPEVGRTPSAAAEPTIKIMSSARGYEMRPDDK